MSEKILVTGAAGFMGSHIFEGLLEYGHDTWGLDNFSGGSITNILPENRYRISEIDLRDKSEIKEYLKENKFDTIFALAASAREGLSAFSPVKMTETNSYSFINLIEPAINYGLNKMILFSSMSIYGKQKPPFTEDMPRIPEDVYAANKVMMEQCLEFLADVHGFKYTIVRPFSVFGERQALHDKFRNVIGIFLNCVLRGEPIWIFGDGQQKRRFSYIADSLPCYINCLDKADGEIINIGGSKEITINILADEVCGAMDVKDYPRKYVSERPREVKYAYCDNAKSIKLLGYDEKVGYKEGIKRMAAWAKTVGPCEWITEKPAIVSDKTPEVWR